METKRTSAFTLIRSRSSTALNFKVLSGYAFSNASVLHLNASQVSSLDVAQPEMTFRSSVASRLSTPKFAVISLSLAALASLNLATSRLISEPYLSIFSRKDSRTLEQICPPLRPVAPLQVSRASRTVMRSPMASGWCSKACAAPQPVMPAPMMTMSVLSARSDWILATEG